jgi:3-dehydroquinate synthase
VSLGERSYSVHVGRHLLDDSSVFSDVLGGGRVLVVTNETVAPLYLEHLENTLGARLADSLVLPDGESYKTLDTVSRIFDRLAAGHFRRDTILVALGGGVIGDLAGFAAACYMRGIAFVQVPTTLLAQADASVGGKTGVNHPSGKNLIGAFHQPRAVLADTATLDTLPDREYRAGLAEVVKAAMIADADFFDWLESNSDEVHGRHAASLIELISRAVRIKADIVAGDEREAGQRALLNLGHTFAHALETTTGYRRWLHGEAVAIGLVQATRLALRMGRCEATVPHRISSLLEGLGLPTAIPADLGAEALRAAMGLDKKAHAGGLRLILPEAVGKAVVADDVPDDEILAVLSGTPA